MDVLSFLKKRIKFIRQYHEKASLGFIEAKQKIENREVSSNNKFSSNDDNEIVIPKSFDEWSEADKSIEMLSLSCISMLSLALKLYFSEWEYYFRVTRSEIGLKEAFKKGFVNGYKKLYGDLLKIDWDDCPADFDILEQIVLARNASEHSGNILWLDCQHDKNTTDRFNPPFFISQGDRDTYADPEMRPQSHIQPLLVVTVVNLHEAIRQVEALCEWLEPKIIAVRFPQNSIANSKK